MIAPPALTHTALERPEVRLIWGGVPIRNPEFTGREGLLDNLRTSLVRQRKASVLPAALHGFGGVGKTQLAIEYVYRYAFDYELVWWISAEQPPVVRASLATLGERLGLPANQDMQQTATTVLDALGASALPWLIVYDNADSPQELSPLLPTAGGHVIITSRNQTWATEGVGRAIEVDVFDRSESVELLRRRAQGISGDDADRLADKLGDLPLALEQAAIWQAATGMPVGEYLDLFDSHVQELMDEGQPPSYPSTVYAFLRVAVDRLREESFAAAQMFDLFAFLAAEPLSATLLRSGRLSDSESPLAAALKNPIAMNRAIRDLRRYGLAKVNPDGQRIQVHRLIQLVMREGLRADRRQEALTNVRELLALANPGEPDEPTNWPRYAEIGPHISAADLIHAPTTEARWVVLDHARYLYRTGDYEGSRQLSESALRAWSRAEADGGLGPDHPQTLAAQGRLANALRLLGANQRALSLDQDTFDRMRRHPELGEDHEFTLQAANQLGASLRVAGQYRTAYQVDQDNLERFLRVYGPEDQRTLAMHNNVAVNLRMLGDFKRAQEIDSEVVEQWRETLGDSDVRTLFSVSNLARDLYGLGRYESALDALRRAIPLFAQHLGPRHNDVLLAGRTMAIVLRKTGRYNEALSQARDSYRAYQSRFGDDHEHTLAATMTYANSLRATGDLAQAHALAIEAVERYTRVFSSRHPLTLVAQVNLAIILRAVGEPRNAYELDSQTVALMEDVIGGKHPYTLCAKTGLASSLALQHRLGEASTLSQQTLETSIDVRGPLHPYTLACAVNAAFDLQAASHKAAGEELFESSIRDLREALGGQHPDVLDLNRGRRAECDIEPPPT